MRAMKKTAYLDCIKHYFINIYSVKFYTFPRSFSIIIHFSRGFRNLFNVIHT